MVYKYDCRNHRPFFASIKDHIDSFDSDAGLETLPFTTRLVGMHNGNSYLAQTGGYPTLIVACRTWTGTCLSPIRFAKDERELKPLRIQQA